jgi:steroid 5-alpha reductase family enzyme
MIALFIMRLIADEWTTLNWAMMAISAVSCLLVFRCFVFVFNFSYSLACVFIGAMLALEQPTPGSVLLGGAMFIYGMRLLLFTWFRVQSESYRPRIDNVLKEDAKLPFAVKIALWVQCTFMYTFHLFAVYLIGAGRVEGPAVIIAGITIMVGTAIEAVADSQKQHSKNSSPDRFISSGIFARWRHPNYAGEIIVQVGLIGAGIAAVSVGWGNYAAVIISPLYVILLMVAEGARGDDSMEKRHGEDGEFRDYKSRSGSLLPKL